MSFCRIYIELVELIGSDRLLFVDKDAQSRNDSWYMQIAGIDLYISEVWNGWVCLQYQLEGTSCGLHDLRKVLLLDGDILIKRSLKPLLRLDPLSAGKDPWFDEFLDE